MRWFLFSVGCVLTLVAAGLAVFAWGTANPYGEKDTRPFSRSLKLDGSETRIAFTATTSKSYELRINIDLPAESKEKEGWVRYSCLMGSAPSYHQCQEMGHLKIAWIIRDLTSAAWHDWYADPKPSFEAITGTGTAGLGWFTPARHHDYIITVRAQTDVPTIGRSPATLYAYFGNGSDQGTVAFGDLFASILLMLAAPFALIGVPLLIACWPRGKTVQTDA